MILIINICKEKLHYYEFVKPIEDILKKNKINFFTRHYKELKLREILNAEKIIICGTSLVDNEVIEEKNVKKFKWIKNCNKPILGICGGMHVLGKIFGGKLKQKNEIGLFSEHFKKEFLGIKEEIEVYHLHNYYIDFSKLRDFEVFNLNNIPQAVKHKNKEIYGVLFHPEVRNKKVIEEFVKSTNFYT